MSANVAFEGYRAPLSAPFQGGASAIPPFREAYSPKFEEITELASQRIPITPGSNGSIEIPEVQFQLIGRLLIQVDVAVTASTDTGLAFIDGAGCRMFRTLKLGTHTEHIKQWTPETLYLEQVDHPDISKGLEWNSNLCVGLPREERKVADAETRSFFITLRDFEENLFPLGLMGQPLVLRAEFADTNTFLTRLSSGAEAKISAATASITKFSVWVEAHTVTKAEWARLTSELDTVWDGSPESGRPRIGAGNTPAQGYGRVFKTWTEHGPDTVSSTDTTILLRPRWGVPISHLWAFLRLTADGDNTSPWNFYKLQPWTNWKMRSAGYDVVPERTLLRHMADYFRRRTSADHSKRAARPLIYHTFAEHNNEPGISSGLFQFQGSSDPQITINFSALGAAGQANVYALVENLWMINRNRTLSVYNRQ